MTAYYRLLQLAEHERNNQSVELAKTQRQLHSATQKFQQLLSYHQEYTNGLTEPATSTVHHAATSNRQAFLHKLSTAMTQQQLEIDQLQQRYQASLKNWHKAEQHVKTYQKLTEQHNNKISAQRRKTEQQSQDEAALTGFKNKSSE